MKKTLLYDGVTIQRKPPVNYHDIKNVRNFIHLNEFIEPCYLCELSSAYVSPYGIVFKNGQVVKESVYSMFTKNKNALTFYKKILLNKVKKVSGDCLVAHNAYYDNYYHWTLEALPRIFSVKEHTSTFKLLIPEKLKLFIEYYLSFFNFKEIILIKEDELIWAEKIWLPMHTAPGLRHNESLVREMAGYIKVKNDLPHVHKPIDKLFISRKKATFRKAINEDEVYALLQDHGFQKVVLEELSVKEQINLLHGVKIFAGIHGAGFSNLMYMDQGKLLIDIIHEDHQQDAFYNLASAFNINYARVECKGMGAQKYCGSDDIIVNIHTLASTLDSL
jgi:capsular polysaccharide biosynthesis protein